MALCSRSPGEFWKQQTLHTHLLNLPRPWGSEQPSRSRAQAGWLQSTLATHCSEAFDSLVPRGALSSLLHRAPHQRVKPLTLSCGEDSLTSLRPPTRPPASKICVVLATGGFPGPRETLHRQPLARSPGKRPLSRLTHAQHEAGLPPDAAGGADRPVSGAGGLVLHSGGLENPDRPRPPLAA